MHSIMGWARVLDVIVKYEVVTVDIENPEIRLQGKCFCFALFLLSEHLFLFSGVRA